MRPRPAEGGRVTVLSRFNTHLSTTPEIDVAVVGAGLAGLCAARALRAAGRTVRVLEASARVGGRTFSRTLPDGAPVELGGAWIGPGHTRMAALAHEHGIARLRQYREGENVFETPSGVIRYRGHLPSSTPAAAAALREALTRLRELADAIPLQRPWAAPRELDEQTVASWLDRHVADLEARAVLHMLCEAVIAADAGEVSLAHLLFFGRASGGLDGLIAVEGGAGEERLVDGTYELAVRLAAELSGQLVLRAPVRGVRWSRDSPRGGVQLDAGEASCTAGHAILAIAPALAGRLSYDPPLPSARDALTQRIPHGAAMKCVAVYERPFWREEGLSGHGRSLLGPAKGFFDVTPAAGRPGMIMCFVEAAGARRLALLPARERRERALDGFARLFGPHMREALDYHDLDLSAEPYIRGCYAGYLPPGAWTRYGEHLRAPVGPLHWAGTETAVEWYGYMEGAVRSGERAAAEVLAAREP
jgi:monoamine oxidase